MKATKKLVCAVLLLLLVIGLTAGCAANGETASRTKATVIQVFPENGTLLIEIDEDSRRGGAQAVIPVDDPEKFEEGDRISFYPGGDINETSPLQITKPRDVKKILW